MIFNNGRSSRTLDDSRPDVSHITLDVATVKHISELIMLQNQHQRKNCLLLSSECLISHFHDMDKGEHFLRKILMEIKYLNTQKHTFKHETI